MVGWWAPSWGKSPEQAEADRLMAERIAAERRAEEERQRERRAQVAEQTRIGAEARVARAEQELEAAREQLEE